MECDPRHRRALDKNTYESKKVTEPVAEPPPAAQTVPPANAATMEERRPRAKRARDEPAAADPACDSAQAAAATTVNLARKEPQLNKTPTMNSPASKKLKVDKRNLWLASEG